MRSLGRDARSLAHCAASLRDVYGDALDQFVLTKLEHLVISVAALVSVSLAKNREHVAALQKLAKNGFAEDVAPCHVVDGRIKKGGEKNRVDKRRGVIGGDEDGGIGFYPFAVVQVNLAEQQSIHHMDERGKKQIKPASALARKSIIHAAKIA